MWTIFTEVKIKEILKIPHTTGGSKKSVTFSQEVKKKDDVIRKYCFNTPQARLYN